MSKDPKKTNPIFKLWNWLSIPVGIISLAGLSDGLVAWKGFVNELVVSYQNVIYPFWNFVLGWLPISLPQWIGDYLTIGILVYSASRKSYLLSIGRMKPSSAVKFNTRFSVFHVLLELFAWPFTFIIRLLIICVALGAKLSNVDKSMSKSDDTLLESNDFWKWLGATLLGFLLLLVINYAVMTW